ncbi:ATP-dependent DNA helicase RecG [Leucothrix pacifica]|uniref:ATP-dependent DNA helicase RecG n=1 Tax=Leucothrix pacifica TaxID=1247513 RepID=UPI00248316AA|nr:ATP-dependent DNA helicase RecG [Leucothrix pacifica]
MHIDNPLLDTVTSLKGVGPKMAENLEKLNISSIQDLLFHLPSQYQDRTRVQPIATLQGGHNVLIEGVVEHTEVVFRGRRMMLSRISDGTGKLTLRFFYFGAAQQKSLSEGTKIRCFGEIRQSMYQTEMIHPEYTLLDNDFPAPLASTLTAIYPATKGLQQRTIRRLMGEALKKLSGIEDLLPGHVRSKHNMPALSDALKDIHQPDAQSNQAVLDGEHPGIKRLAFEEMLAHQLSLRQFRLQVHALPGIAMKPQGIPLKALQASLPFALTKAQQRVIKEIKHDLAQPSPMSRLVQGDVGSGKTLVAAAAALLAIEAGYQVALMAPTEILAEQHLKSFEAWLEPLGFKVGSLSGKQKAKERRDQSERAALGMSHLVVGTHALFQNHVSFAKLGLIIIDEQHRFGVEQRLALRDKGNEQIGYPHQLVMTATPIPRTLAMTAYADMDYSIIDELPPGRTPIKTVVIANSRRDEIISRIQSVCESGAQVYWVCTLIEESEALQCENAEETESMLKEQLPSVRVGLVHGRMSAQEKQEIMQQFKSAEISLLVATTVIEVGVDVPNASLMIIENAERLGLAQLHQLRGRVGRGSAASSCVLMYQPPLSKTARKRLDALRNSSDGFEIAQIDLEIRGPGEVFGTRQTGELQFRIADLVRDQAMLPEIQKTADLLLAEYPETISVLIKRWIRQSEVFIKV